ncbi:TPA: hypothetical protein ACH3X2_14320 [Trebouxia sp. C0005]
MPKEFLKLRVIPGEEAPVKELVDVYVANIAAPQASQLVKLLGQIAPLGQFDHLKRVRKQSHESSSLLQIILCPRATTTPTTYLIQPSNPAHHAFAESARPSLRLTNQGALSETLNQTASTEPLAESCIPLQPPSAEALLSAAVHTTNEDHGSFQTTELSSTQNLELPSGGHDFASQATGVTDARPQQHQHLPEAVSALVQQHKLQLQIVKVPKHAPASREQWKDWNQVWPISWRKPELTAVTAATAAAQAVTADEEQRMHAWMDRAFTLGEANEAAGGVCNAAVIVNPVSGKTIAEGQDGTKQHPLRHAIMAAIDAAAARDRRLWPSTGTDTRETSAALSAAHKPSLPSHSIASDNDATESDLPAKRRRTSAAGSFHETSQEEQRLSVGTQPISPGLSPLSSSLQHNPVSSTNHPLKSYLCTGFDCYVVQEPCAMCAMAATHARLRRICYSIVDSGQGVLGGALKLHGQTSLNHHYQVFHLPVG